jgi:hypothetical protein
MTMNNDVKIEFKNIGIFNLPENVDDRANFVRSILKKRDFAINHEEYQQALKSSVSSRVAVRVSPKIKEYVVEYKERHGIKTLTDAMTAIIASHKGYAAPLPLTHSVLSMFSCRE